MEVLSHPVPEKLRAFSEGRLSEGEAGAVADHLLGCAACCAFVEHPVEDSFVGKLRRARALGSPTQEFPDSSFTEATGAASTDRLPGELASHPRYRVLRLLGEGGMGAVYLAEHRQMVRSVALKVINPRLLSHPGALSRFQQEVQAAAKLDHPNIVAAYDAEQANGLNFLVMEYVEGRNLADHLAENGPLAVAEACDVIRQAALGLQHAHERGMVHRDIKPHNLMRTLSGRVKVLDFGLARLAAEPGAAVSAETQPHLTGAGAVVGTADYIAPEQARDAHGADGRADIYSLGCTLYHLLTGKPPFPDGPAAEKLQRHALDEPASLCRLRPDVPEGLAAVVERMMAKQPEDRHADVAAVAAALAPYARPPRAGRRRRKALKAVAALAMVMALTAVVAVGLARWSSGEDHDAVSAVPKSGRISRENPVEKRPPKVDELLCFSGHQDYVNAITLTPDGRHVLSASGHSAVSKGDYTVRLWHLRTGEEVRKFQGDAPGFRSVVCSADGKYVFGGCYDGVVWMWELHTARLLGKFAGHTHVVTGLTLTPDGERLLTAADTEPDILIWNVKSGRECGRLTGAAGTYPRLVLDPAGKRALASGTDGTVGIYDIATRTEVGRLEGPYELLQALAVSADGKRALTATRDRRIRLWNLETGKELGSLPGPDVRAYALAFSPDGRRVLTAGGDISPGQLDFALRLWDLDTGTQLAELSGHKGTVTRVLFTSDGGEALSSSWDSTVRRWKLPDSSFQPKPGGKQGLLPPRRAQDSTGGAGRTAFPIAFREIHGADERTFQNWIAAHAELGFRAVALSVLAGPVPPRFNGIALRDGQTLPTSVRVGMSPGEPAAHFHQMCAQNYRPLAACMYGEAGRQKQAHIWIRDSISFGGYGVSLGSLHSVLDREGRAKRMMPVYLSAELQSGSSDNATIILVPDRGLKWEAKVIRAQDDLHALAAAYRLRGWRLTHVAACANAGGRRLLTVAAENPSRVDWHYRIDISDKGLDKAVKEQDALGLRPLAIASYLVDGAVRYTAVWERFRVAKATVPDSRHN